MFNYCTLIYYLKNCNAMFNVCTMFGLLNIFLLIELPSIYHEAAREHPQEEKRTEAGAEP